MLKERAKTNPWTEKALPSLGRSVAHLPSSLGESRYQAACRWTGVWRTNWNKDKRDGVSEWVSNGCTWIRERWGFFLSQEHIRGRDGFETASSGWLLAALLCRPAQKVNSTSRAFPKRGSKKATGKKSRLRKSEKKCQSVAASPPRSTFVSSISSFLWNQL